MQENRPRTSNGRSEGTWRDTTSLKTSARPMEPPREEVTPSCESLFQAFAYFREKCVEVRESFEQRLLDYFEKGNAIRCIKFSHMVGRPMSERLALEAHRRNIGKEIDPEQLKRIKHALVQLYWKSKKPIPMEIKGPAPVGGPSREDRMKEEKGPDVGEERARWALQGTSARTGQ